MNLSINNVTNNSTHNLKTKNNVWLSALLLTCALGSGCSPVDTNSITPELSVTPGAGTGENGLGQGPASVNLGMAGGYAVLASSGISAVPGCAITGNVGISPAAASFITGFSLSTPPSTYSTSTQVTGQVFASDYNPPTPSNLTTAVADMGTAYTDAAGRAPDYTELGAGDISGLVLPPGVYKWSTGVLITANLRLVGGPSDTWIFQIAGDFTMASGVRMILFNGARAKNIVWQTFGNADIGTTAHFEGILLSQTAIVLRTKATTNGRLLAQTAVTLDQNVVVQP